MNFSDCISNKLMEVITKELDYNDDKKEIIVYAIETAFLFILGSLLIIILGCAFNALMPTVIAAVFGGLLRRVSGGAHFNAPIKCLAFGAIIYSSLGVLAKRLVDYGFANQYILMISLLLVFLLVAFLAPVDSEAKPIHSSSFKFKLKISSLVLIIIVFLIINLVDNPAISVSAVLGVSYQSITLLPVFNRKRHFEIIKD